MQCDAYPRTCRPRKKWMAFSRSGGSLLLPLSSYRVGLLPTRVTATSLVPVLDTSDGKQEQSERKDQTRLTSLSLVHASRILQSHALVRLPLPTFHVPLQALILSTFSRRLQLILRDSEHLAKTSHCIWARSTCTRFCGLNRLYSSFAR